MVIFRQLVGGVDVAGNSIPTQNIVWGSTSASWVSHKSAKATITEICFKVQQYLHHWDPIVKV